MRPGQPGRRPADQESLATCPPHAEAKWQHYPGQAGEGGGRVADSSGAANAAQAQRWNGESARRWIANRERHQAGRQRLLPHLFAAARISPGERVLDVGCGCGETTITAARSAAGGGAAGLDLSGPMLAVARRLAAEAGVANAAFAQGNAQACPLRRDSCDVMISSFGVMFFDDPAAAFANITAALRHGGRLAFLCWQQDMRNELFAIPLRAFQAFLPLPDPDADDVFTDPRQIAELLSGAGCTDIQIDAVSEPAWAGSDVTDVMAYVRGTPMVRRLAAQLGDHALTEQALAAAAGEYAARQRSDGVWVRTAAWLAAARRG
jgi:SAM-dependent methyltransferase